MEGTESRVVADTVILAIGQEPDMPESFGLDPDENNRIEVDFYTSETNTEGVYAAGDSVSRAGALIGAIASGRKCAIAVDSFLGGSGSIDENLVAVVEPSPGLGLDKDFAFMDRCEAVCVSGTADLELCRVVQEMDASAADHESGRCLLCDLRMKIATVKVWGSY